MVLVLSVNSDHASVQVYPSIRSVFMHVDNTVPLWAFWDLYGNTQKLRMLGSTQEPVVGTPRGLFQLLRTSAYYASSTVFCDRYQLLLRRERRK